MREFKRRKPTRGTFSRWLSPCCALAYALTLLAGCGATHRAEDDEPSRDRDASAGENGPLGEHQEGLIPTLDEPEVLADDDSLTGEGGAGQVPHILVPGRDGGAPVLGPAVMLGAEEAPEPELPPVTLVGDTSYAPPGVFVDDRAPHVKAMGPATSGSCNDLSSFLVHGQRTTAAMGVQLRLGLLGPAGMPLDASSYASCVGLFDPDGVPLAASSVAAPATNALTMLLVQPGATEEENALLADAAMKLFMSRPRGERVALYRWGPSVQQVTSFTNFRDSFSDALTRSFPVLEGEPVDAGVAVTRVSEVLEGVGDDAHAWARTVVVLAPHVVATDLFAYQRNVNVVWAVNTTGASGFQFVPTVATAPADAMGHVSARLNAIRDAGLLTLGVCGDGQVTSAQARSTGSDAFAAFELKDALVEEMSGACDAEQVASFERIDTRLIELQFTPEQREVYDDAVSSRDETVDFQLSARISPSYGLTPTTAHLRGGTSLVQCPSNRMNFSIDLDGGRERFFFPESGGSVGSDEFYLTAMCLDPMYVNQYTMDRMMASLGMFVSGVRLVEVRVDGTSQGVYLLMEQVKEAIVRSQSGLLSVVRRRDGTSEVKFPGDDDLAGQELALADFDALIDTIEGDTGLGRIATLSQRLDLHRYLFFTAVQSAIFNADWGDEPTFYATATLGPDGARPIFFVNGWDPDDVLLEDCAHQDVIEDPFGLIGCAEHALEKAVFTGSARGDEIVDDELYAMYVDALEIVVAELTEDRMGAFYDESAEELITFAADPAIVEVMPDWQDEDDVPTTIRSFVAGRKETFAARRSYLLEQIAAYRQSH